MNPFYPAVSKRAKHRCEYCRAPESIFNFPFEVEHIIPTSLGGKNLETNIALACRSCNQFKGVYIEYPDPGTDLRIRLFNPRQDEWQTHFVFDLVTTEIVGRTAIGRATIACLKMNNGLQLKARKKWGRLGLFP